MNINSTCDFRVEFTAEFDFSGGLYHAWRDPLVKLCSVLLKGQARGTTSSSAACRQWLQDLMSPTTYKAATSLRGGFFCPADFCRLGSRPAVLGTPQQIQVATRYLLVTDTSIADGHAEQCCQV